MPEPRVDSKRARPRRSLGLITTLLLSSWVGCTVYDQALLDGATGGTAGSPELRGAGGGSSGGGGSGAEAASGNAGASGKAASAGSGAGGKGSGGASGATGGVAGKGSGGAGKGGSSSGAGGGSGTGLVGMAGDNGEGGEATCPMGDCCPDDDSKLEAGVCGCGVPDTDTDSDDTPDCLDDCPDDPAKTAPESCGCGVAEASCLRLKDSLVNRYSFDGTGVTVTDTKGSADGTVLGSGATLDGSGALTLAGGYVPADMDPNKQYVELPPGCLDGLTDATFEAWFDWAPLDGTNAQSTWQRIFDFGEPAASGVGTYIFASPRVTNTTGPSRVSFTSSMGSANQILSNGPVLEGGSYHFTVVVDDTNDQMLLYVDGVFVSSVAFPGALSAINDTSCYLGRSQFVADPYFAGSLDEFRVHSVAFTAADVAFSEASGPNPAFL